jgi:putative ABC transport system permease protein
MSLRRFFRRKHWDAERASELTAYLEAATQENVARGMTPAEARDTARRKLGNTTLVREEIYHMNSIGFLETFWQDLRYGLRVFAKKPAFTAVAVLTLAIGIGANSAVFSVVNSVLLEPLPYRQENRLVMVWEHNFPRAQNHNVVSPANFLYWQDHNTVFDQMAAFYDTSVTLTGEGDPEQIPGQAVSWNFFPLLGISPDIGRDFSSDEGQPGHNHVVLLSHGLWQRKYGGDRDVVGKSLRLNGGNYVVAGVMPPDVTLFAPKGSLTGKPAQLWVPIGWTANHRKFTGRWMTAVARLKPGASLVQAQTQMDSLVKDVTVQYPDFETGWGVNLVPVHGDMVSPIRPTLLVLIGAVGFVLLIACANVANLMLGHAAGREREIAVRAALGATRGRVIRQCLTESIILAFVGGALGLLAASWTTSALLALVPKDIQVRTAHLDWRVVMFAMAVCVITGIAFGVAPAFTAARTDLNASLREGGRNDTGMRGGRLRNALAVAEIALSLVLLASAGLLMKSFLRLTSVDPGFDPHDVLSLRINLPGTKYPEDAQAIEFFHHLLERVRTLPGVRSATISNSFPLSGATPGTDFAIVGKPSMPVGQSRVTEVQMVGSDYFPTMGIRLLHGRTFTDREETVQSRVVIVSQMLAQQFFPNEDPLGQKIVIDMKEKNEPSEIIGIVADVKRAGLDSTPVAISYWPHAELAFSSMMLAVRTGSDPLNQVGSIREIVRQIDPELPLANVATMDQYMADSTARQRFGALLIATFACIALALAAIGIYGVIAYAVSQRTREFGIRMALGAERSDVLWLVTGHGARLAALGLVFGMAGTVALTGLLRELLFGVSPHDFATLAAVAAFLAAITLLASYIPARRAMRVDPMVVLRYE